MKESTIEFAKALADPTRQKIMQLCCCEWLSVGEIVQQLEVTQPTVSHHLAVLWEAGLVLVREKGKKTFYHLNQEQIASCCGQLVVRFAPEFGNVQVYGETDQAECSREPEAMPKIKNDGTLSIQGELND
ncbi:MAG: metalloregulator ArsR/SmtB family transcription factor [Anaerolineaceae bacterium]